MPKYTRRHFRDIAAILRQISPKSKRKIEAEKYCKLFKEDNDNFDKDKFMDACGLGK